MEPILETDKDYICDIQSPCFQTLSNEEVELVRASKTQVLFRKGDHLTKQGTFASYVLFIVKGLTKQYIENSNTKSFNLHISGPGEFIGLSTAFTSKTFDYSSVAITECQAYLVEKVTIAKVIKQNGVFAFNLIQRDSEQVVNLYDTLSNVLFKQMNGRMAETLIYLDNLKNKYGNVFPFLSRKDIADFAGTSTESTVKLLKSFEMDGLIKLNDKDITILDQSKLYQISKIG
jgi:CRP-like cAMP-binding protein